MITLILTALALHTNQVAQNEGSYKTHLVASENLTLYYMPTCPYCKPVVQLIKDKQIPVTLVDVTNNPSARDQLIRKGGKGQVPCLFVNGKPMYESTSIMSYLNSNY